jgi:NAD(P)-dependent dehydrogenase (short-subunit alcohol dehydrogenase family)
MSRTVVVTGGGTGIGRATAAAFARRGDDVLIFGRRREPLEAAAAELGVRWLTADLADARSVEAAFAEEPPVVDVLVNNAGGVASAGGEYRPGGARRERLADRRVARRRHVLRDGPDPPGQRRGAARPLIETRHRRGESALIGGR